METIYSSRKSEMVEYSPKITSKYNNTIHRTINTTPSLASKNPSLVKIKEEIYSNKKPKFKINDRVRIFKYKNI